MSVFPQPHRGAAPMPPTFILGGLGRQISLKMVLERSCANTCAKVGPKVAQVRPKTSKIPPKVISKSMIFDMFFWKSWVSCFCNLSQAKHLLLRVQGLQNRTQNRSKIGSESHIRRGGPQKAFGQPLGVFLDASGAEKKKLGTALCPKRKPKWLSKWHPKTLQDACMRPRRSKKAPRRQKYSNKSPISAS